MDLVDTNVLLYAVSPVAEEHEKAVVANRILDQRDVAFSVQVLQEFYTQATRSGGRFGLTPDQALGIVNTLLIDPVQVVTPSIVLAAIATSQRFQISYWDGTIIEAARELGCDTVLSEDLNHGQDFGGVRVENPFRNL